MTIKGDLEFMNKYYPERIVKHLTREPYDRTAEKMEIFFRTGKYPWEQSEERKRRR